MASVAAVVRDHVARTPAGAFVRSSELAAQAGSRRAVDVELHRLQANEPLVWVWPGLYFKGKNTRFGVTPPDPLAVGYEIARDHGYTSGVGPAGVSAARALGLTTEVPGTVEVAVPGRAPAAPTGVRFTSRSAAGRSGLRPLEVAVLELLRAWPRYSDKSWDEFVAVVRELHAKRRVDVAAVHAAAVREHHREPRERAVRLTAEVASTDSSP